MSGLESTPAFKERALQIGMEQTVLDALLAAGVNTYGKLAFVCSSRPSSGNDDALLMRQRGFRILEAKVNSIQAAWTSDFLNKVQGRSRFRLGDWPPRAPWSQPSAAAHYCAQGPDGNCSTVPGDDCAQALV